MSYYIYIAHLVSTVEFLFLCQFRVPPVSSLYHDFDHDASPYRTRRSPSQGHHHPCFVDDATSYFSPGHALNTLDDYWSLVCSNIIPPPPSPMRKTAYLHPEYTSEDLSNSPAGLYRDIYSPVSALSSSTHSGTSSQVELVCPAPIIPIGIGNYNHDVRLDTGAGPYGLPLGLPVGIPVEILTCRSRLPVATGP